MASSAATAARKPSMASLPLVISGALPLNAMISAHSTKAPTEASAAWNDITSVQHVASIFEVT